MHGFFVFSSRATSNAFFRQGINSFFFLFCTISSSLFPCECVGSQLIFYDSLCSESLIVGHGRRGTFRFGDFRPEMLRCLSMQGLARSFKSVQPARPSSPCRHVEKTKMRICERNLEGQGCWAGQGDIPRTCCSPPRLCRPSPLSSGQSVMIL